MGELGGLFDSPRQVTVVGREAVHRKRRNGVEYRKRPATQNHYTAISMATTSSSFPLSRARSLDARNRKVSEHRSKDGFPKRSSYSTRHMKAGETKISSSGRRSSS